MLVLAAGVAILALAGCAGKDATIDLELRILPPAVQAAVPERSRLKVAIAPFDDARPKGSRLGVLAQVWNGGTPFILVGGEPGEVVAQVFVDYVEHEHGWQAWFAKVGVTPPESGPDVTVSGQVLDFVVFARNWGIVTKLAASMRITIKVENAADGSSIAETLHSTGSQWVFWCNPQDMTTFFNGVLLEGLKKFTAGTTVEERQLRLKQHDQSEPPVPPR